MRENEAVVLTPCSLSRSPASRAQPAGALVHLEWITRSGQDSNLRRCCPQLISSELLSATQAPLHVAASLSSIILSSTRQQEQ